MVFMKLVEDVHSKISLSHEYGKVLLYEREGYTFHAKGLWLTSSTSSGSSISDRTMNDNDNGSVYNSKRVMNPENDLLVSVVGSSNYGSRSEILDFESNCILVMNPLANSTNAKQAKRAIANDWNSMLEYHVEYGSRDDLGMNNKRSSSASFEAFALGIVKNIVRRFF